MLLNMSEAATVVDPADPNAAVRATHHLASLPVLPAPAAAEARSLLLRQVCAAPCGGGAALQAAVNGSSNASAAAASGTAQTSGAAVGARCAAALTELCPPAAWRALPPAVQRAFEWAWQRHFSLFAFDLCYIIAGPGPADARACLLEAMLRFTSACGMTATSLHMLWACAHDGVIKLVAGVELGSRSGVVAVPGLGGLGFVMWPHSPDDPAADSTVWDGHQAAVDGLRKGWGLSTEGAGRTTGPRPRLISPAPQQPAARERPTLLRFAVTLAAVLTLLCCVLSSRVLLDVTLNAMAPPDL
jgi:hypothetical protein